VGQGKEIRPLDWRSQPWKNGGGITHEIARWPPHASDGEYEVRVSLAMVSRSGPFSLFPGYRRWTFLAGASPIELWTAHDTRVLALLGDHIELDGEVAIDAVVTRPTELLNVIARADVRVGYGLPRVPVRFAMALSPTYQLAARHALVYEPPLEVAVRTLWIA